MSGNFSRHFLIFLKLYAVYAYIFFHFIHILSGSYFQISSKISIFFHYLFSHFCAMY